MKALRSAIAYGWNQLVSRRVYFVLMIAVPLFTLFFFYNLMEEGLPLHVPSDVVDLDHSTLSRRVTRNLGAGEYNEITALPESYHEALALVREGEIMAFFVIPRDFERDALSGRPTSITYYSNMAFFVPGTMAYKGFKSTAISTVGGLSVATLTAVGLPESTIGEMINPVNININCPGNPWLNYNYYLTNSFIPAMLALLVALVTAYTLLVEIKHGTSRRWLEASGHSMIVAVMGKLIPQFVVWSVVGNALLAGLYGFCHFPMNCPLWHMILAMELLIIASQWFAVVISCAIPNLRYSVSICSLTGILAFSIAAFSFPVQQMYGSIGIFSYILPIRYYFLIYVDQALNGIALYYSRWYYVALLVFPLVGLLGLKRLYKRCLNPVYLP